MTTTESYENLLRKWTAALAPADTVEADMVYVIAHQDHLMSRYADLARNAGSPAEMLTIMRMQASRISSISMMLRALKDLRRMRRTEPPPKTPATARAKVIPFHKTPSVAAMGRPRKIELEPEPLPNIEPLTARSRRFKERGSTPPLYFKLAA